MDELRGSRLTLSLSDDHHLRSVALDDLLKDGSSWIDLLFQLFDVEEANVLRQANQQVVG
jgi:hypothetical protein